MVANENGSVHKSSVNTQLGTESFSLSPSCLVRSLSGHRRVRITESSCIFTFHSGGHGQEKGKKKEKRAVDDMTTTAKAKTARSSG